MFQALYEPGVERKHSYQVITGEGCSLWAGLDLGAQDLLADEVPRESEESEESRSPPGGSPGSFWSRHPIAPGQVTGPSQSQGVEKYTPLSVRKTAKSHVKGCGCIILMQGAERNWGTMIH